MSRTKAILPTHPLTSKLILLLPQAGKSNSLPVKTLKLTLTPFSVTLSCQTNSISTGPAAPGFSITPARLQQPASPPTLSVHLEPASHVPLRDWSFNILPKCTSNDSRAPHTHTPRKLRSLFQHTRLEHRVRLLPAHLSHSAPALLALGLFCLLQWQQSPLPLAPLHELPMLLAFVSSFCCMGALYLSTSYPQPALVISMGHVAASLPQVLCLCPCQHLCLDAIHRQVCCYNKSVYVLNLSNTFYCTPP